MRQTHISHIAPLHHEWTRGLEFYRLELDILQERMEEIAGNNTGDEVLKGVELFQNQFLIHQEFIAGLNQRIRQNILCMETEVETRAGHLLENTTDQFSALEEEFNTEERSVNELRKEFNRFAAKWM